MIFTETALKGAYIIDVEKLEDERGFFARSWCAHEFEEHGLNARLAQCNVSYNHKKGTVRGMHYQTVPFEEVKLVRCTRGAIYDVIIDLRPGSPTYKQWISVELTMDNHKMLYVPEGFAHGFQTLEESSEVFYQMSEFYAPGHAKGIRWDDPAFGVRWPLEVQVISARDRQYPDYVA
ncbi:MAG TPA: dTDP-4-dehydrorhamnose 3,5-epimerase [Chloroflexia bacterium]|jgi:dTDP-4-dehydrorhamnose 3,5-epimerase